MLDFANVSQIESLFTDMEPVDLAGQPFTPSLHPEELVLEDIGPDLEVEEELATFDGAKLGPYTRFSETEVRMPLVAIDAGVLDLGISRTGFALAFKAAVVAQDVDGTHSITKIGPRVKFIVPDNRAELLQFIGRAMSKEDMFVTIHSDGTLTVKAG